MGRGGRIGKEIIGAHFFAARSVGRSARRVAATVSSKVAKRFYLRIPQHNRIHNRIPQHNRPIIVSGPPTSNFGNCPSDDVKNRTQARFETTATAWRGLENRA